MSNLGRTGIALTGYEWQGGDESAEGKALENIWAQLPSTANLHYNSLFGIARIGLGDGGTMLVHIFHEAALTIVRNFVAATNPLDRWKWANSGTSDEKIAGLIGCSRQNVNNIRLGSANPSAELRATMERELGIPVSAWPEPPNRQRKG